MKPQSPGENSHKMIIREGLWGGVKESEQKNKKPLKMSLTHSNAGSLTWGQGLNPDPQRQCQVLNPLSHNGNSHWWCIKYT